MGSIAGPIISFRFNAPSAQQAAKQLSNVVGSTMAQASKSSANQFVSDWQAAAAKLRAQLSSEKLGLNSIVQAREKIIALAEKERAVALQKINLSRQDLALIRSTTMEIEKQKNALEGFGAVTSPTRKIIQQMISGIGVRAGSYGGGFGSFAGVRVNESLGKMADEATGGRLALLGFGAAAVVVTAAMVDMAKKGADLAVSIRNASEAAGISVQSMVELQSVAKVVGVDSDTLTRGFRKFNEEITLAMGANLPHASIEAKRAAEIFQVLGVNVQKAAADPMTALETLSQTLSKLPEGAVKSYTANELLGKGYQAWLPVLNRFGDALDATKDNSDLLASKINSAAQAGDTLAIATTNLDLQWKTLEVTLATGIVPILTNILKIANNVKPDWFASIPILGLGLEANAAAKRAMDATKGPSSINDILDALSKKFTPTGQESQLLAGIFATNPTTGRGKVFDDFSVPLYLGKADKDYEEYLKFQEKILKEYLEHKKKVDEDNSKNFQQLLFQTDIMGPMGMGLYSPDKTGAGIKDLMDSLNQAAKDTAQKAAQDIVDAWKQWRDEGKSLFEDLLSGGQNFAKHFARDLEDIALKPVQNAFGNLIGNILYELDKAVPNSIGGSSGGSNSNKGGWLGKIWRGMQGSIQPPKSVQNAMETIQNAQITATNVTIYGATTNIPRPGASNFTSDGLLGLLSGGNNFSTTASSGGLLGLLAGNNVPASIYSGGLLSLIGGNMASTSTTTDPASLFGSYKGNGNGTSFGSILSTGAQVLSAAIPGGVLLGAGLLARGTSHRSPASIALGAGAMGKGVLDQLANIVPGGSQGTAGTALQSVGTVIGGLSQIIAGSQTKGLGGVLQGAIGGAEIGTEFLPGIGTGIGAAIGGLISGIFGGGSAAAHQAGWQKQITNAMNNQRVTMPQSETFSFASGNNMSSIFGTTFSQGPGGFSNSTLAANTPFWANAIYGTPRTTAAQIQFNQLMNGLNPNSPFYGGTPNPFTMNPNQLPSGMRGNSGLPSGMYSPNSGVAMSSPQPSTQVHFTIPGYVDKNGVADIVSQAEPLINKSVSKSVYQQSAGTRRAISRSINLP